ncbi:tetratricopeptide repeat protein [Thalassotalea ganghwensis]
MVTLDYEHKKFLVIDSIKQSRDVLKIFSYSLGVKHVDTNHHPADILQLCENNRYDVILLGYDLGDNRKNGQQLLEELRAKQLISRQCIVVMITAEISQAMVLAALEHKPDEYLVKPYTLKDLSVRLSRCFDKKVAMHEIYCALDEGNHHKVIHLCDRAIKANTAYKHECLGIKSRQYFQLKEYDKAKRIYQTYFGSTNCQWAALGLGKIALIENKFEEAEKLFQAVIDDNPLYLSAYDWLARTYKANHQEEKAEQILEQALLVSPRSVKRLKDYAQLCLDTNQLAKATKAFSKTNELSHHSVHKDSYNSIQFVEALLKYSKDLNEPQKRRLNLKAFDVMAEMNRVYHQPELRVITNLLSTRLHRLVNDTALARSSLSDAERLLNKIDDNISIEGSFTIARSLIALHKIETAKQLLKQLSEQNPDNIEVLSRIAELFEQPVSEADKAAAQSALALGTSLYNAGHYVLAIDKLNQALVYFPNHIGIKLNLLQVLLVSFEHDQKRIEDLRQAKVLIDGFKNLSQESESYLRYLKLKSKYESLLAFHTHGLED